MKKALIFIILLVTGCGYQPFYKNTNLENFNFQQIIIDGNIDISERIIKTLSVKEDILNNNLNNLKIESNYVIEETSRDSKNQVQTYRSYITVNWIIIKDKNIIKEKKFFDEFSYSKKENKFDLIQYQNSIKNNLINNIIEEIILFMNV